MLELQLNVWVDSTGWEVRYEVLDNHIYLFGRGHTNSKDGLRHWRERG